MSTDVTVDHIKNAMIAKSLHDPAFRQAFVANPQATVESFLGTALPANVKLSVVEEGPDAFVVVLPHAANIAADGELSDGDLEAVAGGSKAGANKFFGTVGSGLGVVGALPALMPAHDLGGKAGKDWANKTGDKIMNSCV